MERITRFMTPRNRQATVALAEERRGAGAGVRAVRAEPTAAGARRRAVLGDGARWDQGPGFGMRGHLALGPLLELLQGTLGWALGFT